ncbi:MAG: hypothetical protein WBN02_11650 [Sedimenticolaceae bacterium]
MMVITWRRVVRNVGVAGKIFLGAVKNRKAANLELGPALQAFRISASRRYPNCITLEIMKGPQSTHAGRSIKYQVSEKSRSKETGILAANMPDTNALNWCGPPKRGLQVVRYFYNRDAPYM